MNKKIYIIPEIEIVCPPESLTEDPQTFGGSTGGDGKDDDGEEGGTIFGKETNWDDDDNSTWSPNFTSTGEDDRLSRRMFDE